MLKKWTKAALFAATAALVLTAVTLASCSKVQALIGRGQGATEIRSADGTDKVNLTGTWVCKDGKYVYKMIFEEDGSFKYGSGRPGGPGQLSFGSGDGLVVNQEFNCWYLDGKYTTKSNVLTLTYENIKDFNGGAKGVKRGDSDNFLVSIVDDNEIVISLKSIRTYKRQ